MTTVAEHLKAHNAEFRTVEHRATYSCIDEARALGIGADGVLKTVVADTGSGHALLVLPASRRLNMKLVRRALGDAHAKLATEDELRRDFPDIPLGAMPPLGSLVAAPTWVDPEVLRHDVVAFAAGSATSSVIVATEQLFRDEPITTAPLAEYPELAREIC